MSKLESITSSNVTRLTFLARIGYPGTFSFNQDSSLLAFTDYSPIGSAYSCTTLHIWNLREGKAAQLRMPWTERYVIPTDYSFNPDAFSFSPRGDLLLGGGRLWDIGTGALIRVFEHAEFVRFPGKTLLSYRDGYGAERKLWDPATRREVSDIPPPLRDAREFSPDNRFFVTTAVNGTIYLWNARTLRDCPKRHIIGQGGVR